MNIFTHIFITICFCFRGYLAPSHGFWEVDFHSQVIIGDFKSLLFLNDPLTIQEYISRSPCICRVSVYCLAIDF